MANTKHRTRARGGAVARGEKPKSGIPTHRPTRHSRQYYYQGGHSVEIRSIPLSLWREVKVRLEDHDVSFRTASIRLLEYFAAHGFPPGYGLEDDDFSERSQKF